MVDVDGLRKLLILPEQIIVTISSLFSGEVGRAQVVLLKNEFDHAFLLVLGSLQSALDFPLSFIDGWCRRVNAGDGPLDETLALLNLLIVEYHRGHLVMILFPFLFAQLDDPRLDKFSKAAYFVHKHHILLETAQILQFFLFSKHLSRQG